VKALVTGFEPFGGEEINPAWEAVRRLPARLGAIWITRAQLPCSFARSGPALARLVRRAQPDLLLGVGQAGGRAELCLERVGINVQDARIPDNDGARPIDRAIERRGPAARFATLPIKACVAAMKEAGLPAAVSNTAGTFVCNHLLYVSARLAEAGGFRAGFLHVPYAPEQAARLGGVPSLAVDDIVRGIEVVLRTAAARRRDIRRSAGRED